MSNFNFNKVIIAGRLTADPELKQTPNGISVTSFTVAVNRNYKPKNDSQQSAQQADFITVVAWRSTADFVARYFKKGSSICVVGSIQTRSWTDTASGQKRYATEVVADEVNFVDSKSESGAAQDSASYTPTPYSAPAYSSPAVASGFEEIKSDDDLPF